MGRISTKRGVAIAAALALLPLTLVGITPNIASAATSSSFASAWTGTGGGQWVPSPGSANAHGPSNSLCIAANSQPGGAEGLFTFPTFSIPAGNVIDGIEVTVDYVTAGAQLIQLIDMGSLTGTQKDLPIQPGVGGGCNSTQHGTVGGPVDLWGGAFTPADFNAGDIGVRIKQKVITLSSGEPGSIPMDIDSIQLTVHHTSGANQPPTAEANGPYSVPEGGSVALSSAGSSDPDGDPLTIDWDLDDNGSFETPDPATFSAAGLNGPGSAPVAVRVSDGTETATDTATVTITNVAPTIDSISISAASIDEGDSVTVTGTFSDPGSGETYTGSALWDDGKTSPITVAAGTFSLTRSFPDDHPSSGTSSDGFTVDVTIHDGDGGSDTQTSPAVTVNNVAPTIDSVLVSAAAIAEPDSVTVSGTFSDPALGEATETFNGSATWSDGITTAIVVGAGTFSTTRAFADDDPMTGTLSDDFTVDIAIGDDDLGADSATSPTVTVHNVDPVAEPLVLDSATIDEDGSVTVTGSFSDAGVPDTHTVMVDWGDGPAEVVPVDQSPGSGTFSASHQYLDDDPSGTPSDIYVITATVTDDDTGSDTESTSVTVNNVEPVITSIASSATFEDKAEEGETVTVSGAFTDVGTLDTHSANIDWGDGNVESATVTQGVGGGTFTADHAYATGGVYTLTVTVTDDDTGATSDSTPAVVTGVGLNGGVLQIVGTSDDDKVHVKRIQDEIDVAADFDSPKHQRFDLADVSSIEIWLCEGDDLGSVHQSIDLPATMHGGDDDDMLWGGSGPDVIDGEDGDDMSWGRDGDDEMYGGPGDDKLWGGKGSDFLDGGPGNNKLKP